MAKNNPSVKLVKWDASNQGHIEGYFNMLNNQKVVDLLLFPRVDSYEEAKAEIKSYENEPFFAVLDEDLKKVVGFIGLINDLNGFNKNVKDMGKEPIAVFYAIPEEHWGKNYATAALSKMKEFVFTKTNIECLIAYHVPYNIGSRRVLQKAGFKSYNQEVTGFDGRPRCAHSLTRDEYNNSREPKSMNIGTTLLDRLRGFCNG